MSHFQEVGHEGVPVPHAACGLDEDGGGGGFRTGAWLDKKLRAA